MIVKIIPENDEEKKKMKTVEHRGVKEFLIFGNKADEDGTGAEFHDWTGSYRYLEGSLHYFEKTIAEERLKKARTQKSQADAPEIELMRPPQPSIMTMPPPQEGFLKLQNDQGEFVKKDAGIPTGFIKRGGPEDGNIEAVIDADAMREEIKKGEDNSPETN